MRLGEKEPAAVGDNVGQSSTSLKELVNVPEVCESLCRIASRLIESEGVLIKAEPNRRGSRRLRLSISRIHLHSVYSRLLRRRRRWSRLTNCRISSRTIEDSLSGPKCWED